MDIGDIWEIVKNFDVNNILGLIVISVILIILFVSCLDPFFSSGIEVLLMNKVDMLKRLSLAYIVLFMGFVVLNYVTVIAEWYLVFYAVILIASVVFHIVFLVLSKKFESCKVIFEKYKDSVGLMRIFSAFAVLTYLCNGKGVLNLISWSIIFALMEILLVALLYLNPKPIKSSIVINESGRNWYVLRRVDDYLLGGDKENVDISTEFKLFKLDSIENYQFKKVGN